MRGLLDVRGIIEWGGIAGITSIIFVETGLFFGFFLPGDSLLVTAGILAAAGILDIRLPDGQCRSRGDHWGPDGLFYW